MKTKIFFQSIVLFSFLLILSSCGSITMIDNVPEGPKGYVEFYYLGTESNARIAIYSMAGNQKILEGYTSFWNMTKGKVGLRIAKSPGTYMFLIPFSGLDVPFVVQIEEGRITPVKIMFTTEWISDGKGGERQSPCLELILHETVLISEYNKKEGR